MATPALLRAVSGRPLEREFEAWVIAGIERYFDAVRWPARMWAVSPKKEGKYPADERLRFPGKLVGLQFKRPDLPGLQKGRPNLDYSTLRWDLSKPPGQFALVKAHREIYYVLPTFINRDWRKAALDHCVLWRPKQPRTRRSVSYGKGKRGGAVKIDKDEDSLRWGAFVERIASCQAGQCINEREGLCLYRNRLVADICSATEDSAEGADGSRGRPRDGDTGGPSGNGALYSLYIHVPGPDESSG